MRFPGIPFPEPPAGLRQRLGAAFGGPYVSLWPKGGPGFGLRALS